MALSSRFPSFQQLLRGAASTFARFPFTLLSAALGSTVAVLISEVEQPSVEYTLQQLLMASALGLPLFTTLAILGEKRLWEKPQRLGLQALGALALVIYVISLPEDDTLNRLHVVRFLLLNICLHFLVAFLPYLGGNQVLGFWQYNKSLFLRFLTAALYSSVLYLGLTLALASVDYLFGADVKDERYFQLWIVISGVFNTWFFLAGVPRNLEELNHSHEYPNSLKIFTQYVLLPLVALYFVILFAYEVKIIVEWNWPKGWVSQLVLWYSVVGILSLLLLHPLRERLESRWIQVFSKWFFRALIPLVAMLFLAIARRISDYGVTQNRYFVLAMAVGLSITVLYFVASRARDIRIIPIVVCVIAFVSAYGPWGAFSVSQRSQLSRLEALLVENGILVDGAIQETESDVSFESRRQMSGIIAYLSEWHGVEPFSAWLAENDLNQLDTASRHERQNRIASLMGFAFVETWSGPGAGGRIVFRAKEANTLSVTGYDYLASFSMSHPSDTEVVFQFESDTCRIGIQWERSILDIRFVEEDTQNTDSASLSLAEVLDEFSAGNGATSLEADQLTFDLTATAFDASVILNYVTGQIHGDTAQFEHISGRLLFRKL